MKRRRNPNDHLEIGVFVPPSLHNNRYTQRPEIRRYEVIKSDAQKTVGEKTHCFYSFSDDGKGTPLIYICT